MIKKYLFPNLYIKSVYNIDFKKLKENGIKLIIFDIDNTLKTYEEKVPSKENIELFNKIKSYGLDVCLLSNGRRSRVERYNETLNLRAEHMALKPLRVKLRRLLKEYKVKKEEVVIIGDQVFTDVLVGNRMKIMTILVEPIKMKDTIMEKIKRKLEKMVIKLYNNKQHL